MARKTLAVLLVTVLIASMVAPVAAHSWQTEVEQGDFELGISSTPEEPVAGMNTEFSARIADATPEGIENRTDYGSVTNAEVSVHINGPGDVHDHVSVQIPEDDSHFGFDYIFPQEGTYTITVVTELEGEEYAFEFQRNVILLPAKATGEEMEHLSEDVHAVGESVDETNANVQKTNKNVEDLEKQVSSLQDQVDTLQGQLETLNSQLEKQENTEPAQAPGFGVIAALLAAVGAAFIIGKRR